MPLTAGLTVACEARSGGVKNVWLANVDDVTSFTLTGDDYSAATMVATKVFYEFEFEQDTAERRENISRENGSTVAAHEVEFFVPKMSSANRAALAQIIEQSNCGIVAIIEDSNSVKWVVGYSESQLLERPLKVTSDASLSGKALSDLNGSTVIIGSTDTEKARVFTGTVPV